MLSARRGPDFKLVASLFYSKHMFGNDNFRTGITLNYIDSESDFISDFHGSLPAVDTGQNPPGYTHRVGDWTTFDWQISYEVGPPAGGYARNPGSGLLQGWKTYRGRKGDLAQAGRIQLGLAQICWPTQL